MKFRVFIYFILYVYEICMLKSNNRINENERNKDPDI